MRPNEEFAGKVLFTFRIPVLIWSQSTVFANRQTTQRRRKHPPVRDQLTPAAFVQSISVEYLITFKSTHELCYCTPPNLRPSIPPFNVTIIGETKYVSDARNAIWNIRNAQEALLWFWRNTLTHRFEVQDSVEWLRWILQDVTQWQRSVRESAPLWPGRVV